VGEPAAPKQGPASCARCGVLAEVRDVSSDRRLQALRDQMLKPSHSRVCVCVAHVLILSTQAHPALGAERKQAPELLRGVRSAAFRRSGVVLEFPAPEESGGKPKHPFWRDRETERKRLHGRVFCFGANRPRMDASRWFRSGGGSWGRSMWRYPPVEAAAPPVRLGQGMPT
jgi:hypothetical protein